MMKRKAFRHGQRGIALLEALVAIVIFTLGVLGIFALQAKASQFSVDSENRARASLLANELASRMWEAGTTRLDSRTINAWRGHVLDIDSGLPAATATDIVDANGVARITITWRAPWRIGRQQPNTFMTEVMIP